MARKLTTPVVTASVTHQALTGFKFNFPHAWDPDEQEVQIQKEHISMEYAITTYNSNGGVVINKLHDLAVTDMPGPIRQALKALYEAILDEAEAAGVIGSGTDEALE